MGGVARRGPDPGTGGRHRVRRGDGREQFLEAVDAVLVLVEHVREVRVGRLVGDRVDRAPGREGRDRHLGHQGEGLVAVEGARQEVGGLDEEAEGTAAQTLEFAEAGGLHGQGDAVGGELEAEGLFVGVAVRRLGGHTQGAGEPALDLEGDGDHRAHAGGFEERDGAGNGRQVLVDRGHPGGAVAAGAGLDGYPGEALAGGGEAGGRPYLQFRLVVGGEEQEGGVAVEHVAGAFHRALQEAVEVVGGRGADEDLEGVDGAALGARFGGGALRGLEDGPLVLAHQEADGGGFALGARTRRCAA